METKGVPRHEFNIQPYGNLIFDASERSSFGILRSKGLGLINILMDSHIHDILTYLSAKDLGMLSRTSWIMMVLVRSDVRVWKDLVALDLYDSSSSSSSSKEIKWRESYWRTYGKSKGGGGRNGRDWVGEGTGRRKIYSDVLYRSYLCYHCLPPPLPSKSAIPTIPLSTLTYSTFVAKEVLNRPFVISGLSGTNFPALTNWRPSSSSSSPTSTSSSGIASKTAGRKFRCTSVQSSHAVSTCMEDYGRYAKVVKEESPMYLFERDMGSMVEGYRGGLLDVMPWFTEVEREIEDGSTHRGDLFNLLGEDRPDWRWLIVGPVYSGSAFHIDPNCTHAWNMPVKGRKLWVFYPPGIEPPGVRVRDGGDEVVMPVSLGEWVLSFWDEHKRRMKEGGKDGPMECVVGPGEVLFVPHGWWHCVINIPEEGETEDDAGITIAITQNYVSSSNLSDCLRFLERKKSQISGLGDRCGGEKAKQMLGARLEGKLKEVMGEEEWGKVVGEKNKGFGCNAWKNDTVSVMQAAKEEEGLVEGEGGGGGGGFSFDFGM